MKLFITSVLFAMTCLLVSCDLGNDPDIDQPSGQSGQALTDNASFYTTIRFETEDGKNILSSIPDLPKGEGAVRCSLDSISDLKVKIVREKYGESMTLCDSYLYYPDTEQMKEIMGEGPVLQLNWQDKELRAGKYKTQYVDQQYIITLSGTTIVGNYQPVIKWTIQIHDVTYLATKCSVNNKDFDFINDAYYQSKYSDLISKSEFRMVDAFIHIVRNDVHK